MIKFCNAGEVGEALHVSSDHVRHLIRDKRLWATKLGGPRGDYLIHPVDVERLRVVRSLSTDEQDPLKPDIVWVIEACNFLIGEVRSAGFNPEYVVGIMFGGLFPASFISATLRVPFLPLRAIHYDGTSTLPRVQLMGDYLPVGDGGVLIVDDIVDTGDTFKAVQAHLVGGGAREDNLRFAALHKKPHSKFEPNWYVSVVGEWVHYPWEVGDS